MAKFSIDNFAKACIAAMDAAGDNIPRRQAAATACLKNILQENSSQELIDILDDAIPPNADLEEMVVHQSPDLTMLYGRLLPHFQSAIHNHTIFACIAQLEGQEINTFYERDSELGLRVKGEQTAESGGGSVLELLPNDIHCINNPNSTNGSALHIYGGDFRAVMNDRSIWAVTKDGRFIEEPFSYETFMKESVIAMQRDGNQKGLETLVKAIPALGVYAVSKPI